MTVIELKTDRTHAPARKQTRQGAADSRPAATESPEEELPWPQTLPGVFDSAFDFYKNHFAILILIVALVLLPLQISLHALAAHWLYPLAARVAPNEGDAAGQALLVVGYLFIGDPRHGIPGLITLMSLLLVSGPMTVAVSELYLGLQPTVAGAYRAALPYTMRLLGGYLLIGLIYVAIVTLTALVSTVLLICISLLLSWLPEVVLFISIVLYTLPLLVGFLPIARFFAFLTPLSVLEGAPIAYLSGRNSQLVGKARTLRTWLALVFLPIITFGFQGILLSSIDQALDLTHVHAAARYLLSTASEVGVICFLQPFWMIVLTLLYYDYRVHRECFDIRLLTAGQPALTPASPPDVEPPRTPDPHMQTYPGVPVPPLSPPVGGPFPGSPLR